MGHERSRGEPFGLVIRARHVDILACMGVSVREALTRRLDLLSEEQALAVLTRMDEEEAIRAVPAPPEVVGG